MIVDIIVALLGAVLVMAALGLGLGLAAKIAVYVIEWGNNDEED